MRLFTPCCYFSLCLVHFTFAYSNLHQSLTLKSKPMLVREDPWLYTLSKLSTSIGLLFWLAAD
jgi:hypothetical protein